MSESLARKFHETYERLALQFGYETRQETKAFDPNTPNGRLMAAVCEEIIEKNHLVFVGDNDHGDAVPDYNRIMDELVSKVYKLEQERDQARRIACYQYAKKYTHGETGSHENKLVSNFAMMHGWKLADSNEALDNLSKLDQELGLQ